MVGYQTASLVKVIHAGYNCFLQVLEGQDFNTAYFPKLLDVIREYGSFQVSCFIRAPCRENLYVKGIVFLDLLVPYKGIGGGIRGADQGNAGLSDQAPDTHFFCLKFGVA